MKVFAKFVLVMCLIAGSGTAFADCGHNASAPSSQPADVKFENHTKGKVNVIWYKFDGGTRNYRTLAPGQAYVQATFREHIWEFTDAKGKCISTFLVKRSQVFKIR